MDEVLNTGYTAKDDKGSTHLVAPYIDKQHMTYCRKSIIGMKKTMDDVIPLCELYKSGRLNPLCPNCEKIISKNC